MKALIRFSEQEKKIVTQTLIFDTNKEGKPMNCTKEKLESIAEKIASINPVEAQIYTLARFPAEPFVIPVDYKLIEELATKINQKAKRTCAKAYPNSENQRKWILEREKEILKRQNH